MDTQQETGLEQNRERLEKSEKNPAHVAKDMLAKGHQDVMQTRAFLADVSGSVRSAGSTHEDALAALATETDAAWKDFEKIAEPVARMEVKAEKTPTDDIDEGWETVTPSTQKVITREEGKNVAENSLEAMNREVENAFRIGVPSERFIDFLKPKQKITEDMSTATKSAVERKIVQILDNATDPFPELERAFALARQNQNVKEILDTKMTARIGTMYLEKIRSSSEYLKDLKDLSTSLAGTLGEKGPVICSDRSLMSLITIHETFGKNVNVRDIINAMNISTYSNELELKSGQDIIKTNPKLDPETQEILGETEFWLRYQDGLNDSTEIKRGFVRKMKRDEMGQSKISKYVDHKVFELTPNFHGKGIAAKITKACLEKYDQADMEAIVLAANIDTGSYAWATYGYGWDWDQMNEEKIREVCIKAKKKVLDAFIALNLVDENGLTDDPKLSKILVAYDEAIAHPEAVTPSALAKIGKDGPSFYYSSAFEWYTEEGFKTAFANGDTEESQNMKGAMHAGKIGLYGGKWSGKIELTKKGPQKGLNRKLLEQKIAATLEKSYEK